MVLLAEYYKNAPQVLRNLTDGVGVNGNDGLTLERGVSTSGEKEHQNRGVANPEHDETEQGK